MKYLFFDIECANCYNNCAKIFSLGYVITDENFNILHDKEDVLINPKDRFDWYVAKKMMAYPRSIFADLPPFPAFYERFREMFEDEDTIVVGYAVTNDVHFLQDDCKRYDLTPFTYRFYDVQQIYARQPENNTAKNLEDSLLSWCGIEAENLHRSDEDAYNTMLILKAIAAYHGKNLPELLEMYPDCGGETHDFVIDYAWKKPEEAKAKKRRHRGGKKKKGAAETAAEEPVVDTANLMERGSRNAELFVKYLDTVRPKKTRKPPLLSGHTVTVSLGYQRYHFNEMLYLVQMITNAGGRYTLSSRDADTLYTYDCGEEGDSRLAVMEERREAGEEVEIYPIKLLFDLLETSEVRLSNKPRMDLSYLEPEVEGFITGTENEESDAEAVLADDVAIDGFLDMSDDTLPV
ncbi:MAG: 3'-5' exonuclease [Ruminococcaceae bacterium]|nr:3'-5' exonuclease [Oscillospiraceae bacterium]